MTIKYTLVENHLTSDPDDYMARVISAGTVDENGLIDDMLKRGSTLTSPDILATLNLYHEVIIDRLLAGQRVNTSLVNLGTSLNGVFTGLTDQFDSSRHMVLATAHPGILLRQRLRDKGQRAEKTENARLDPNPSEYFDFASESKNSVATPGQPGQLIGHRLKFDAADPQQGIFFVNDADSTATRAAMIMRNKPGELMFIVPEGLAGGDYLLQVRAVLSENGELRSGHLSHILAVA